MTGLCPQALLLLGEVIQTPDQVVSRALYLGTLAGRISYPTWPGGPEELGLCLGKGHDLHYKQTFNTVNHVPENLPARN